jgi:hypothetical protein
MSTLERVMIAGCGALTPVAANLLVVDLDAMPKDLDLLIILGHVLRAFLLFGVGAFFGYLHDETNRFKLFQLGLAAPAFVLAAWNGNQLQDARRQVARDRPAYTVTVRASTVAGPDAGIGPGDAGRDQDVVPDVPAVLDKQAARPMILMADHHDPSVGSRLWQGFAAQAAPPAGPPPPTTRALQ